MDVYLLFCSFFSINFFTYFYVSIKVGAFGSVESIQDLVVDLNSTRWSGEAVTLLIYLDE